MSAGLRRQFVTRAKEQHFIFNTVVRSDHCAQKGSIRGRIEFANKLLIAVGQFVVEVGPLESSSRHLF